MNFDYLQEFITAAHTGSFHIAAKILFTNTSSISRHIHYLENELGNKLFERNADGVLLTSKGKLLLEKAEHILREKDDMYRLMNADRDHSDNRLIIGIHNADAYLKLFEHRQHFNEYFPDTNIEIHTFSDHLFTGSLLNHHIDIAIELFNSYNITEGISSLVIDNLDVYLGVSQENSVLTESSDLKILEDMTLVIPRRDFFPGMSDFTKSFEKSLKLHFRNVEEVNDVSVTMTSLDSTEKWTPIPAPYIRLKPQNVRAIPCSEFPTVPLMALWASDNRNPNLVNFLLQIKGIPY